MKSEFTRDSNQRIQYHLYRSVIDLGLQEQAVQPLKEVACKACKSSNHSQRSKNSQELQTVYHSILILTSSWQLQKDHLPKLRMFSSQDPYNLMSKNPKILLLSRSRVQVWLEFMLRELVWLCPWNKLMAITISQCHPCSDQLFLRKLTKVITELKLKKAHHMVVKTLGSWLQELIWQLSWLSKKSNNFIMQHGLRSFKDATPVPASL